MFTGLITDIGTIRSAEQRGDLRLTIGCRYDTGGIPLGASIACSGACLTVVDLGPDWFAVALSAETVARTAPGLWREGQRLNLERALRLGDELGGHLVTGHVDGLATLVEAVPEGDSTRLLLEAPPALARMLAPKGSVTLDGVSLTVNSVEDRPDAVRFGVNVIAHTAAQTTLSDLEIGRTLNLEVDILARYLQRMVEARHTPV